MRLAIVGAGGFVGSHLARLALAQHCDVTRIVRQACSPLAGTSTHVVTEGDGEPARQQALRNIDAVVMLAARVHRMRDPADDPLAEYLAGNRDLALTWAHSAAASGVSRLVFVSSVKAAAERSSQPLRETAPPVPEDAYGVAKLAAEDALMSGGAPGNAGLQCVVVRPPLVYGPGVQSNFLQLLQLAESGWPLPLARASARRSMISVTNLCDALLACAREPAAAGQRFYVSDGVDLSIAELLARLRACAGLPPRLFPVPRALLRGAARALGRGEQIRRLLDPLQVDSSAIRAALGWRPPQGVEQGLQEVMQWFMSRNAAERRAA